MSKLKQMTKNQFKTKIMRVVYILVRTIIDSFVVVVVKDVQS